jgi:hypothetical protein
MWPARTLYATFRDTFVTSALGAESILEKVFGPIQYRIFSNSGLSGEVRQACQEQGRNKHTILSKVRKVSLYWWVNRSPRPFYN